MIQFYLRYPFLFLAFFALSTAGFGQVRYVKADATGANNGASWADAYVSLDSALADAEAAEVWVAAGVYKPGGEIPDTLSRFAVTRSLSIYGGFAGTETDLSERDPAANPTILDGDINGDDIAGDYIANKSDNVLHVVYVDSLIQDPVTLDGLVIRNGHANDFGDLAFYFEGGAGVWSYSPLQVVGCDITQNYAGAGAGVLLTGPSTANSLIDDCTFTGNASSSQATLYANGTVNLTVSNSTFTDNSNNRGCAIILYSNGVTFDNCTFDNNDNPTGFASVGFIWQTINFTASGCTFTNNSAASSAGAFYFDAREIPDLALEANINFEDCLFEGNEAPTGVGSCIQGFQASDISFTNCDFLNNSADFGGAIYLTGSELTDIDPEMAVFDNCVFEGNVATGFGGGVAYLTGISFTFRNCTFDTNLGTNGAHLFTTGDNKEYLIRDCVFENGDANFGGAMTNYGANSSGSIINCEFRDNNAGTSGGAIINGFKSSVVIDSCTFDQNVARFGGAMYNQNDTTDVTINNSDFIANSAEFGGAIYRSSGLTMAIDHCNFEGNVANDGGDGGSGGAILSFDNSATENLGSLSIANSFFDLNFANAQGGAIDLNDTETSIVSSVFANNSALNGAGGAIINNVADTVEITIEVEITNSTFANNLAGLVGANLAQFTSGPVTANTYVQNNIFFTELGANYAVEDGTPNLISNGGNLSNDSSMEDFLTAEKDVNGQDPLFVNANNNNFRLGFGSPAIDGGIADGAPEFDIEGNPRIGDPDKGAYEYDPETDTREEVQPNDGQLKVFPNPAGATAQLQVTNDWQGELNVQIFDLQGKLLRSVQVEKVTDELQLPLNLLQLPAGNYQLTVSNGDQMLSLPLLRQ